MRTSQVNGCAYCLQSHSLKALACGETDQRLRALPAWRESPYFTAEERAILAFTEEVTRLVPHHLSEATYDKAVRLLVVPYVAHVLLAVTNMNAWNQLGIAARLIPAYSYSSHVPHPNCHHRRADSGLLAGPAPFAPETDAGNMLDANPGLRLIRLSP